MPETGPNESIPEHAAARSGSTVALVAGMSPWAGRGIAVELGVFFDITKVAAHRIAPKARRSHRTAKRRSH